MYILKQTILITLHLFLVKDLILCVLNVGNLSGLAPAGGWVGATSKPTSPMNGSPNATPMGGSPIHRPTGPPNWSGAPPAAPNVKSPTTTPLHQMKSPSEPQRPDYSRSHFDTAGQGISSKQFFTHRLLKTLFE